MGKTVNSASSSSNVHVMADHDKGESIMFGRICAPLSKKEVKNYSLPLSPSRKAIGDKHLELVSNSSNSISSSYTPTTGSEPRKFKRRTRVDLDLAKGSGAKCIAPSSNSSYVVVDGPKLDPCVRKPEFRPYDICFQGRRNHASIGATLPEENKKSGIGKQDEWKEGWVLRPGMVLLKNFISHDEQVEIVKVCRELGLGPGGFYQPGYATGAKLRLKMMCLGWDWDPQTYKYRKKRVIDGSTPPSIPNYFSQLVTRAIQEAQCLTKKEYRVLNVEDVLPLMTPDICIVNFYTNNGKLGLHQDRDESKESLRKGLPVVSFSIGDSADFLYGDERDVDKAESVILESGDVLIFGGDSRHVFHGVPSVFPNSAPKKLLRDSCLSAGRLNLTFRQY
ncbi:unnamed protein product [Sphenostylis stenocarpa]|uniref:DNA N(6)-methyladenine demethylase n=1 Tax=Sphenostylis stenocarpa TaxID=92480 RepID=A0AA86S9E9_9FABA|nr:unnamed protein product [Sphenostylis stenocarpa]